MQTLPQFPFIARRAAALLIGVSACAGVAAALPRAASAQAASGITFNSLYSFTGDTDGANPLSGLVADSSGNLYGTTQFGGPNDTGSVYKITSSGAITPLHNFGEVDGSTDEEDTDGGVPVGALALGNDGNLYGTTSEGGAYGSGTIFQISPSGTFNTIYTFSSDINNNTDTYGNTDGSSPTTALTLGRDGNFYGTTYYGGPNDSGTVFKLSVSGTVGTIQTLYSFSSDVDSNTGEYTGNSDGANPQAPVVFDNQGNLYGTTYYGGINDQGAIFELNPSTAQLTTLHSFSNVNSSAENSDGVNPYAALVLGSDGNFYGTATGGGTGGFGTIFKITTSGMFTTLYSFTADNNGNLDGGYPEAALVQGSDGNFYGTASVGGAGDAGSIFSITPSGSFSPLYYFSTDSGSGNADGSMPSAPLLISNGIIYSTTVAGGLDEAGTVFALTDPSLTSTTPSPSSTRFDFNGDGHADLIWYNTGSGDVSVWDMDDLSVLQYGATFTSLAPSSGWQPVAAPDVNDDGVPDLVWWNKNTGELSAWTLELRRAAHSHQVRRRLRHACRHHLEACRSGGRHRHHLGAGVREQRERQHLGVADERDYGNFLRRHARLGGRRHRLAVRGRSRPERRRQVGPALLEQPDGRGVVLELQLGQRSGAELQRRLHAGERHELALDGQRGHQRRRPSRPDLVEREHGCGEPLATRRHDRGAVRGRRHADHGHYLAAYRDTVANKTAPA